DSTPSSPSKLKVMREEVAARTWPNEAFFTSAATEAVTNVVMTHAWRGCRSVSGLADLAAVLLYGLSSTGLMKDAEADTFWSLSELLAEESILGDEALAWQAKRLHRLHLSFDPPVAELLQEHGLEAMPALRLGALLLSRAGFPLVQLARLWDALLADPRRFEFADDLVLALLLLTRGDLLQRDDVGGLAESLLAAPLVVDLELLLRRAYAICALRRQHGPNDQMPFPKLPEGIDLDSAVAAAQEGLSSLWGKVRAAGAGYWEAASEVDWGAQVVRARQVVAERAPLIQQQLSQATSAMAEAAASAAAALEAQAKENEEVQALPTDTAPTATAATATAATVMPPVQADDDVQADDEGF
ncbi:TBC1 domain family member 13, partial [Durusdinium trenchii]